MLPGIGIFGSDPISKILIQILKHFEFEIHAIWTNSTNSVDLIKAYENDSLKSLSPKLITTSIDNVLLNKNVNLIFVCCQPNLHSQISTKALNIGKNVICLFPTCKNLEDIQHMILSAKYYPSLISSINYGGLKYLNEFKTLKNNLNLIGDLKICNININCKNLVLSRLKLYNTLKNEKSNLSQSHGSLSSLIDNLSILTSNSSSPSSINWLSDKDLGAGVLNIFGSAMISFILNLFSDKKVTKVFGSLKTLVQDLESKTIRKITSDDYCMFQLNLEPGSIIVNVSINSLAQTKYSQEVSICGTRGVLVWKDSKICLRTLDKDLNNNASDSEEHEIESDQVNKKAEEFLEKYKNLEETCPELPFVFIRGLYHYLENVKNKFLNHENKSTFNNLENFEHTKIVQLIINKISLSSTENRWLSVNY